MTLLLFHTFCSSLQLALSLLSQLCLHQSSPTVPTNSMITFFPAGDCPSTLQLIHRTELLTLDSDWTYLLLPLACKASAWIAQKTPKSKSKSHYDWQSVSHSVLVSGAHVGPVTNFSFSLKFSFRQLLFAILWRPLWWEDGSVIYCCCWSSPAQSR
jgi:hypothetical protein